jgi:hypothetical protein
VLFKCSITRATLGLGSDDYTVYTSANDLAEVHGQLTEFCAARSKERVLQLREEMTMPAAQSAPLAGLYEQQIAKHEGPDASRYRLNSIESVEGYLAI